MQQTTTTASDKLIEISWKQNLLNRRNILLALSLSAGAFVLSRSSIRSKLKSMLMGTSCCQSKENEKGEQKQEGELEISSQYG